MPRVTAGSATSEGAAPRGIGFVLGGGGKWGAVQVGMLQALVERDVVPQVVLGCSIGAINGAWFVADPTLDGLARLRQFWERDATSVIADVTWADRLRSVLGRRASLFDSHGLRRALEQSLPASWFADLQLPFRCVAACVEDASEQWFDDGPLVDALLASSAIPGLLPPAVVGGKHYYDGGLVNSIPLDRAVALGCREIYVLQVGRVEQALPVPTRLYQAPMVAFEIARRHRFATFLGGLPEGVTVHVLPSGNRLTMDDTRQLKWRRTDDAPELIRGAYDATRAYLDEQRGEG